MLSRNNRFNLNVVNYLIQVGFKFFFNVALCSEGLSYSPPPPLISSEKVFFSSSFESLTSDPKVVLDFFLTNEVVSLGFKGLNVGKCMNF